MAEFLLLKKGRFLNLALALFSCFFLVTTGVVGQTEPTEPTITTAPKMQAYFDAGLPNPTVISDQDDYAPGMVAIITGSGWTLDSSVDIHLEEEPAHDHHHGYHGTQVDANGNWRIEYPIEWRHLGVTFTVIVDGKQTGFQATTVFTDANVRFSASGPLVASGNQSNRDQIVVNYSLDGGPIQQFTFSAPGANNNSTIPVNDGVTITYTFNNIERPDGTVLTAPGGTATVGTGRLDINANYSSCTAPSSLTYSRGTTSYCTGTAITPNTPTSSGGAVTSYSISSTLPAGLSFNTSTGVISGTPTATSPATNYTITANNACGSTTAIVSIAVGSAPSSLSYSTPVKYCVGASITPNSPTVTGSVTSYTISPSLPAGLNFNSSTGVISGTPTATSAASNYTVTATNSCGSTTANVNIGVNSAPTVSATNLPASGTISNDSGACSASVAFGSNVSTTGLPAPALAYSLVNGNFSNTISSPYAFPVGTTTVYVRATNSCGSADTSFTVTVTDNQKPVIAAVETINRNADPGSCGALIEITAPTASDNCSITAAVTGTRSDNLALTAAFPVGSTTITWNVTDVNNNAAAAVTQSVTVKDNEAPVVPVLATVSGECSATVELPTTTDNCAGTLTATTNDPLTYTEQGTHTVTFLFDDGNGNQSTATQTVVIDDVTAPVVPVLATVSGECSATVELPTTTDNCAGTLTATTNDPLTYTEQGTHTVTFLFDDGNGNQSTATQTVVIDDVTAPVVPVLATVSGECSATVELPTTTDNCAGTLTATTNDPLTYTEQGTHTVTFLFDDGNGNQSTATQTVVIDDVTAPVVPVLATVSGECSATVELPTTTDNCAGTLTATTNDPLTYTEQGTHTVTFLFDDGNGNQSTATQTVVIDDVTAPVVPVLATVSGECSATVELPTTTDNCAGTLTATTNDPLTYTEQGTHTVTFLFDDGNGNQSTATQTVVIDDVTAPVVPVLATVSGECSATVELPTTTDNCAGTLTATTNDPLTYTEQGTHTVTFLFDDGNGNQSTATQTVVIDDVTAPVVPVLATVSGECSATVELPTTTDNCAGTLTATTNDPLTYTEQGTHTVTFLFDDGNGNQSTATQTVVIDDVTAPVVPVLATVSGECSATVELPTTTDNCAGTLTATTNDPLTYTEQGTHTVTFLFDDGNGNQSTATQTVVIDDVTAPVVPVLATVSGECSATVELPTTTDNCAGTLTATTNDPLTYTEQGTHTVTFLFDDGNGNQSTATQTVVIDDVTAPVVPVLATVSGECSATVELPTTTDNCAGTLTATTNDPLTYTEQGTHTVTFLFDDGNGNQSTATQTVVIDDVTAPVVPVLATVSGECSATVELPTTTDNCAGTLTATTNDPLTYTEQGTHTVTFLFDDGNGNQSTATQTVVIDDVTAAAITCVENQTRSNDSGTCTYTVNEEEFDLVSALDNCKIVSITNNINNQATLAGAVFEEGETIVEWTVTDAGGNETKCSFTVKVTNEAPVVDAISAPEHPVQVGSTFTLSANYTDNNIQNATWIFSTGSEANGTYREWSINGSLSGGKVSNSFNTAQFDVAGNKGAGVYSVKLVITDFCGVSAELVSERYVVIFDPTGGFVTGGGWIESPLGASKLYPLAVGRANFGFNAKYKTGKNNLTEVDGHTNFQFKAGDLHFSSFEHEDMSLVIAGKKATYTGYGTVNGSGVHRFRVIAIDGQANGGTGQDEFRIKIWGDGSNSEEDVLYDNMRGVAESSDLATVLGGGSIVIHKPKSSGKSAEVVEKVAVTASEEAIVEILESMAVAPNPVREEARVRFSLIEDAAVVLRVFDFNGREVERLFSGNVRAHEVKEVSFQRKNLMSGVYILKLTTDRGNSYDKQIIVE